MIIRLIGICKDVEQYVEYKEKQMQFKFELRLLFQDLRGTLGELTLKLFIILSLANDFFKKFLSTRVLNSCGLSCWICK